VVKLLDFTRLEEWLGGELSIPPVLSSKNSRYLFRYQATFARCNFP
jgi:hypothetical protein